MDRVSIERMCASREFQLPSRRCRRRKGPRGKVASNTTVHGDGIPNGMGIRLELGNGKEWECRNRLAVISSTVPGVSGHAAGVPMSTTNSVTSVKCERLMTTVRRSLLPLRMIEGNC